MKINKATFDLLPPTMQAAFKANPANADEFDNGEESAPELKAALDRQKAELAEKGRKLSEFESAKAAEIEAAKKAALAEARTNGDFKTIEDDYKAKIKALEDDKTKGEAERKARIQSDAIGKAAGELAKMFVSPSLASPAIKARLQADIDAEGNAIVRVLDKDGKPTGASVEDLKKEFLTDKELKGSLVASNGSGGEFTLPTGGGESPTGDNKFDAANAKPGEMIARLKAKGIDSQGD